MKCNIFFSEVGIIFEMLLFSETLNINVQDEQGGICAMSTITNRCFIFIEKIPPNVGGDITFSIILF